MIYNLLIGSSFCYYLLLTSRSLLHGDIVALLTDPYGQTGTVVDVEIYSDIQMVKTQKKVDRVLSQYLVNVYAVMEKQIVVLRKPPKMRSEVQLLGSVDSVSIFLSHSFYPFF
jgi:hypothetical protein